MISNVVNLAEKYDYNSLKSFQEQNYNQDIRKYINYVFENWNRKKISRYLIESIRDSLDLNQVLQTAVNEIGKLLKADRCLITGFNQIKKEFELKIEPDLADISITADPIQEIRKVPDWNLL